MTFVQMILNFLLFAVSLVVSVWSETTANCPEHAVCTQSSGSQLGAAASSELLIGTVSIGTGNDVLYSAGEISTGTYNGHDVSVLETNVYGYNARIDIGLIVGARLIVPAGGWTITQIDTFMSGLGSNPASASPSLYVKIVTDYFSQSSTTVWGDLVTDRLSDLVFTGIYRVTSGYQADIGHPIMKLSVSNLNIPLPAGTYHVLYSASTTNPYIYPYVPPVTPEIPYDGSSFQVQLNTGAVYDDPILPITIHGFNQPTGQPTGQPSGEPTSQPTGPIQGSWCVDIGLFDSFGDGWGEGAVLRIFDSKDPTAYLDFSNPDKAFVETTVCLNPSLQLHTEVTCNNCEMHEYWEMYYTISETKGKKPKSFIGAYDTVMSLHRKDIDVREKAIDYSHHSCSDKCSRGHNDRYSDKVIDLTGEGMHYYYLLALLW
jgi:hypothetical protein